MTFRMRYLEEILFNSTNNSELAYFSPSYFVFRTPYMSPCEFSTSISSSSFPCNPHYQIPSFSFFVFPRHFSDFRIPFASALHCFYVSTKCLRMRLAVSIDSNKKSLNFHLSLTRTFMFHDSHILVVNSRKRSSAHRFPSKLPTISIPRLYSFVFHHSSHNFTLMRIRVSPLLHNHYHLAFTICSSPRRVHQHFLIKSLSRP